jgi:hypothetical protein
MPVCDARTQNGDRAFCYMVIENIFISEFRKSDPYYIITVIPAKHWLLKRDAEQEGPEEPGRKADAGIEPDRCPAVPRSEEDWPDRRHRK